MLLEFSVENFRSIKEKEVLSLVAEASKSKSDNLYEAQVVQNNNNNKIKLVKSAVIYGPNASGKSNVIKAMGALRYLVVNSTDFKVGFPLPDIAHAPHKLDLSTAQQPVSFSISFILDGVKHDYAISFSAKAILSEKLDYYPKGQPANLFTRSADLENDYTTVKIGKSIKTKDVPSRVFNNQLYLSKFGVDFPHEQLTEVYKYFADLEVWNALDRFDVSRLCRKIATSIANDKNEALRQRLATLVRVADTRIDDVKAIQLDPEHFNLPDALPDSVKEQFIEQNSLRTVTIHKRYYKQQQVDATEFDLLDEESEGTKVLFALGGIIIKVLEQGGVLFFDELDNSLHADLCKFLVRLFNNPISNPKGAQLVFATHEITLLDKVIFRKDQIWFTKKDRYGATILYSAKDIEGVREDTNFETRYRTGKFGAIPKIKELQFIYPEHG